jgi:hypothetical protein
METLAFYNELQEVIDNTDNNEYLIIAADFNAPVGNHPTDQNIGSEGENNREILRNFSVFNNLKITNTLYWHKDIHKYACEAHGTKSLTMYFKIVTPLTPSVEKIVNLHEFQ